MQHLFCHILGSGCMSIIAINPVKSHWWGSNEKLTSSEDDFILYSPPFTPAHPATTVLSPLVASKRNCGSTSIFSEGFKDYLFREISANEQMVVFLQNSTQNNKFVLLMLTVHIYVNST